MTTYVIALVVAGIITANLWFRYLFPKAEEELAGGPENALLIRGRNYIFTAVALALLGAAMVTFIRNRGVLDQADLIKLAIKVWFGFLLPVVFFAWSRIKSSFTALLALSGLLLLFAFEAAILADWLRVI